MMIFLIILILKIIRRSKNFIYNQLYSRKQDFLTSSLFRTLVYLSPFTISRLRALVNSGRR